MSKLDWADAIEPAEAFGLSGYDAAYLMAPASLYGVGTITDQEDSPHLLLDKIKGELYYAFAETDQAVPAHIPDDLKKALD